MELHPQDRPLPVCHHLYLTPGGAGQEFEPTGQEGNAVGMSSSRILVGDCIEQMRTIPDQSVHCCVTSPPYWTMVDYGVPGQIGLEATIDAHLDLLSDVFGQVLRVLRSDGTLWVNYGDAYNTCNGGAGPGTARQFERRRQRQPKLETGFGLRWTARGSRSR